MTPSADSPDQAPWPIQDEAIREVFSALVADGSWGRYHGPHCGKLVTALAEYHGCEHVQLCCSGTAALELALRAVGVEPGDEVILSAYDFKANFLNVLTLQAAPVLVDTLPGRPVLDPQQLQAAVTDKTRAIICSHLHGSLTPMRLIGEFAKERGLSVIEDACQSPGALLDGQRAGTYGDVGILSFGGSKLLTSGRGGALLTSSDVIAQRLRLYNQRGNEAYPLSEMQAALLLPQLLQLDQRNLLRTSAVQRLLTLLDPVRHLAECIVPDTFSTVSPNSSGATTTCMPDAPAFYKVAMLLKSVTDRVAAEEFVDPLQRQAVPVDVGFPALHRIHSKRRFRTIGELPHAALLHHQLLVLHHPILLAPHTLLQHVAERLIKHLQETRLA